MTAHNRHFSISWLNKKLYLVYLDFCNIGSAGNDVLYETRYNKQLYYDRS